MICVVSFKVRFTLPPGKSPVMYWIESSVDPRAIPNSSEKREVFPCRQLNIYFSGVQPVALDTISITLLEKLYAIFIYMHNIGINYRLSCYTFIYFLFIHCSPYRKCQWFILTKSVGILTTGTRWPCDIRLTKGLTCQSVSACERCN